MKLKEFMNTEEYREADIIQYVNTDGEEIDTDESKLLEMEVVTNKLSGGYLEIELDNICTREVILKVTEKYSTRKLDTLCNPQESADFLVQRLRYNLNDNIKIEIVSATDK
jgi:hypothetical protein